MTTNTVLVLGGGVGGLVAANELRARLGDRHRVVLVEKNGDFVFSPSLPWLMVGWRRPGQVTKPVDRLVRPGVELVRAEVQEIDAAGGKVVTSIGTLEYDALVVALGADLAPDAMSGYAQAAHNFFDLDGAAGLRKALQDFRGGRLLVAVSALPYKCPAAPYEAAFLLEDALRRRGLRRGSQVEIFTPEPQPMPVAGPVLGQAVTNLLAERGILYHPNRPMASIDPEGRELVFQDGARESFDLLAAVPPHRAPQAVRESALANEAGWVPVDKKSMRTRFENVYALGDVTSITLSNGKPLPKAGVFAHAQALAVARSVAAQLEGGRREGFDGTGFCWVELGRGEAGFAAGNFYAEPSPAVNLQSPGRLLHWGKVLFENYWLGDGLARSLSTLGLKLGGRWLGMKVDL
ncbi:MAG: NAD(P)/FAD-dependent oxidoreductase [Chloroflexi bacterium]|nr:NAD(P)/FAD-dependent oxidoreductase [Chloroflexota bacterium]